MFRIIYILVIIGLAIALGLQFLGATSTEPIQPAEPASSIIEPESKAGVNVYASICYEDTATKLVECPKVFDLRIDAERETVRARLDSLSFDLKYEIDKSLDEAGTAQIWLTYSESDKLLESMPRPRLKEMNTQGGKYEQ